MKTNTKDSPYTHALSALQALAVARAHIEAVKSGAVSDRTTSQAAELLVNSARFIEKEFLPNLVARAEIGGAK